MKVNAYAKVNIALDVVSRRSDGYHELDMIMAPISLYDELDIQFSSEDSITCADTTLSLARDNTITKAVKTMKDIFQLTQCFTIHLTKNIPTQAGLGGGSADAAAVLHTINEMCHLNCSLQKLIDIGVTIGADVPFCLVQKVSRVKGIGEKITPISYHFDYHLLLVKPDSGVSTKQAFECIDFDRCIHPNMDIIEQKLNQRDESFVFDLENTLEQPAYELNEDIKTVVEMLEKEKFEKVLMSGSGSCVFAISKDNGLLEVCANRFRKQGLFAKVVTII